jgi:Lrp/AsnC family leucine-responsive transcriptional regulator
MKFGPDTLELDAIDRQVLTELQADAKISLKDIGEKVGLAAPSVMERVRKMEQAGIITGYHAVVDARSVGLDVAAFIGVSVRNHAVQTVEAFVLHEQQVLECHHVTGRHTLMLKVKVRDTRSLEHLIGRIRSIDGVERTETMVVLSSHTERVNLALELAEEEDDARGAKRIRRRAS